MYDSPTLERRFFMAAEHLALREHVRFDPEALLSLKAIIHSGVLKMDAMEFCHDEARIEETETILLAFIRNLIKTAKAQSNYKINRRLVEDAINHEAIWPFS